MYEFHSKVVFVSYATLEFDKDLGQSNWHDYCTKPSVECFIHSSVNNDKRVVDGQAAVVKMAADIGQVLFLITAA